MNSSLQRLYIILLFFLIIGLFSACGKRIRLTTNALSDVQKIPEGFKRGSSFWVAFVKNDLSILTKEISYKLEEILKNKGYHIKNSQEADFCLLFDYGFSTEKGIKSVPVYMPGKNETITGRVYGSLENSFLYTQNKATPGDIVYVKEEYTYYLRYLTFNVYDADLYLNTGIEDQVWHGSAMSAGESSDIRAILDYLFTALFTHFGKNTRQIEEMILEDEDPRVETMRKVYNKSLSENASQRKIRSFWSLPHKV